MDLLSSEYFKIIDLISQYDSHLMIIKGWSITVGMALIGYAFQQKKKSILLLCIASSICFAFIDAKFKEFQVSYYPRLAMIEDCKQLEAKNALEKLTSKIETLSNCTPLQINGSWHSNKEWYGIFIQFGKLNVLLPHFILAILAFFLYMKPSYLRVDENKRVNA